MMQTKSLLAAGLAALLASAVCAERPFLLPSSTNVTGPNAVVTIDAAASDNLFQFDHRPVQLAQIKVWRPDGTEAPAPQGTTSRFRSSFDLKLDMPGTWKIATINAMVNGTAKINGEERRVSTMRFGGRPGGSGGPGAPAGGPPPAGGPGGPGGPGGERRQPPVLLDELPADATDLKLTETLARIETFVTTGEPTKGVFGGDTHGLTLQPISHPTDLVSNEPAKFRFLIDGQPAAKLAVHLIAGGQRYRNSEAPTELTTDAQGIVTIKWPAPGIYLLSANAEDSKTEEKRAAMRRLSYAATLEVAAP